MQCENKTNNKFINIQKRKSQPRKRAKIKMKIFKKVKEIAQANKEGFTISLLDFKTPKKGFCVAMQLTQNHFGDEGLKKVIEIAKQSTFLVGGWYNDCENLFYYDCSMIIQDLETALKLGKANQQKAIFDLENQKVILL